MIAVDTNLLVRVIIGDDEKQAAASLRVLEGDEPVLVLNSVLLETAWVLESVYNVPPAEIAAALQAFLGEPNVLTESVHPVDVVGWYLDGMDFADAIHLAGAASRCEKLATFDSNYIRKARGKTRCVVARPG